MFKKVRVVLPVLLVFVLCVSAYAKLMGEGEITGEVMQSWISGERVVFRLNISSQTNDKGPGIGNPNTFVYGGADKTEVTEGDVVKLRYNSDDADGIIAEKLEFANNKPGSVGQSKTLSLMIALSGLLIGVILVVGGIIYQKRRNRI